MTDGDVVAQGRDAIARRAWEEGLAALSLADDDGGLDPEGLELLAKAAFWCGVPHRSIEARERAFARYLADGRHVRAASVALDLAHDYFSRQVVAVAAGWLGQAQRLLEDVPESVEHGKLAATMAFVSIHVFGDLDAAMGEAVRAAEIGQRFGDRDLATIGRYYEGEVRARRGDVAHGMQLVDEAMAAAIGSGLEPVVAASLYCFTLELCFDLGDARRADEWTEAVERCYTHHGITLAHGDCRIHRAGILRMRGSWAEAETQARLGCEEVRDFPNLPHVALAEYEIGEIWLRRGLLAEAEDAFRRVHACGLPPQPGLALLRLARGDIASAAVSIRDALTTPSFDQLSRARLLPAQVEIALAAHDLDTALAATEELEATAQLFRCPAIEAAAFCARGTLQLAANDPGSAVDSLRHGWRQWHNAAAPYEAARARVLVARALRARGDDEDAAFELQAAASEFKRLGAVADERIVNEALGRLAPRATRDHARVRVSKAVLFTDIVGSTQLVEAIGDESWEALLGWHDDTLRATFLVHGGDIVKHSGDGFFVVFDEAAAALEGAIAIQRSLDEHRRAHGFAPQVRIGTVFGQVTRRGDDYAGKIVHLAARVADHAGPSEILTTRDTVADLTLDLVLSEPRLVELKGFASPAALVGVAWK